MSVVSDAIKAMKEVMLLTDKVEQAGNLLSEVSQELREHDRRLIRIETFIEIAQNQSTSPSINEPTKPISVQETTTPQIQEQKD